jgi:hypothetical protein
MILDRNRDQSSFSDSEASMATGGTMDMKKREVGLSWPLFHEEVRDGRGQKPA